MKGIILNKGLFFMKKKKNIFAYKYGLAAEMQTRMPVFWRFGSNWIFLELECFFLSK